jgi:hypothetical protein
MQSGQFELYVRSAEPLGKGDQDAKKKTKKLKIDVFDWTGALKHECAKDSDGGTNKREYLRDKL